MLNRRDCVNSAALSHQRTVFAPSGLDFGAFRRGISKVPDAALGRAVNRPERRADRAFPTCHHKFTRRLSAGGLRCYNLGLSRGRIANKPKGFPLCFNGLRRVFRGVFAPVWCRSVPHPADCGVALSIVGLEILKSRAGAPRVPDLRRRVMQSCVAVWRNGYGSRSKT